MYFKIVGFIKRDYLIESRYKLNFILSFVSSILPVLSFFFVAKLVEGTGTDSLDKYGGDYFSFALIGISFTRFFQLAVDTFSGNIKRAQMAGCLEAILSSQTDSKTVVLLSSIYSFVAAGVQLLLMFAVGVLFLGFDFSNTNVLALVFSLLLSFIAFISLGIFSAAGTVIFKQGEPVGWLFGAISALLGGAMFPISVMPEWLQFLSKIFPITYALDVIRLAILKGYSMPMMWEQLSILGMMSCVLFPLSLRTFHWAVEQGKRDGTLMSY
ncbi:ABC transporter permease [Sphingobacterium paludis]|uniref:Transport permease protein n=1 Tax=Sphingobacterium paludis TaxID=1476465 RepID=A0A4R7CZ52_9SPHI|nr:ABC transporter permease [Sphingobacterium paludis]TDS13879.1 ABC-2 type transport system permease protein [Sphingobacterium paludis]